MVDLSTDGEQGEAMVAESPIVILARPALQVAVDEKVMEVLDVLRTDLVVVLEGSAGTNALRAVSAARVADMQRPTA